MPWSRASVGLPLLASLWSLAGITTTLAVDALKRETKVSWDFGSGPGKTSNFYVGNRMLTVRYSTPECLSRFTLEEVRYEFSDVERGGELVQEGPPFVMLTFRKHFGGDFKLLPRVTITQNEAGKKGKPTGRRIAVVFPFREKEMAAAVADWSAADVEVELGAPGEIMDLHNPYDWFDIEVGCE